MFIKHLLFRLCIMYSVAGMRPEAAVAYLSSLIREARKLRCRQWAIPFLETQKQHAKDRLQAAPAVNFNHRSA